LENKVKQTVMKNLNKVSQKTTSAIAALMLGAVITFTAAMSTFGETNNLKIVEASEAELAEIEMLERAYIDTFEQEEVVDFNSEVVRTIKVYGNNDELLETIELGEGEVIEDINTQNLIHKAEFLSEYNNTSIYKISI
jgi:hypothetical protein